MTVLPAILVPACAVLVLLLVGAVIAIVYGRRRRRRGRKMKKQSVAVRSIDRAKLSSTNTDEAGAGLVDKYIVQLKRCIHSVVLNVLLPSFDHLRDVLH